nr:MAG TPA: hypothetical protein [Caudoviricetes sp.]
MLFVTSKLPMYLFYFKLKSPYWAFTFLKLYTLL